VVPIVDELLRNPAGCRQIWLLTRLNHVIFSTRLDDDLHASPTLEGVLRFSFKARAMWDQRLVSMHGGLLLIDVAGTNRTVHLRKQNQIKNIYADNAPTEKMT
jgi:hypothetical protein